MSRQGAQGRAALDIPEPGGLVLAGSDDVLATRAKAGRHDLVLVPSQRVQPRAAGGLPDGGRRIPAVRDDQSTVPLKLTRLGFASGLASA